MICEQKWIFSYRKSKHRQQGKTVM
jgi:hypothetical protein